MVIAHSRNAMDKARLRIEALSVPEPNSGCWIWLGSLKPGGYGNAWLEGRFTQAHRVSYLAFRGPIPDGMQVCHQCDNKACVNPNHLHIGTGKQNMKEARERGLRAPFYQTPSAVNTSGFVGVSWSKQVQKWKATIRRQHLGYFDQLEDAVAARRLAEAEHAA